jgi:hypothetical protein
MTQNNNLSLAIPVAILIFDNDGQITYRAYSPSRNTYEEIEDDEEFQQFLARLYNHLAYDNQNHLNNITNYGCLKEIHTRYIQIPIQQRGNSCFFSTYINRFTNYKPVHHPSPILFDVNEASDYANEQRNLIHCECPHEFI